MGAIILLGVVFAVAICSPRTEFVISSTGVGGRGLYSFCLYTPAVCDNVMAPRIKSAHIGPRVCLHFCVLGMNLKGSNEMDPFFAST